MLLMKEHRMARKRYFEKECVKVLRAMELQLAGGSDIPAACRSAGPSDVTYYRSRAWHHITEGNPAQPPMSANGR